MTAEEIFETCMLDALAHCERYRIRAGLPAVKAFMAIAHGVQPSELELKRMEREGVTLLLRPDGEKLVLLPGYGLAVRQITIEGGRCVLRNPSPRLQ